MIDYKSDDYHRQRHPEFIDSDEISQAWSYYSYWRYIKPFLPKSILEIGGALGYNLSFAHKEGVECEMVEPSNFGRERAEALGIKTYETLTSVKNKTFDMVLIRHVLEHVIDPKEMLNDAKTLLSKNGIVVLVLPIEDPLRSVSKNDIDNHLFCWNPQSIANLCQACGYTKIEVSINWFNGKRLFMPIWRRGKRELYCKLMSLLGRLRSSYEMVIVIS
jgi:SAM-dependent methyltransferase